MHHFVTEMCTHVRISVTKWCIVGYGTGALWDLCKEICCGCFLVVNINNHLKRCHHRPWSTLVQLKGLVPDVPKNSQNFFLTIWKWSSICNKTNRSRDLIAATSLSSQQLTVHMAKPLNNPCDLDLWTWKWCLTPWVVFVPNMKWIGLIGMEPLHGHEVVTEKQMDRCCLL